MDITENKQYRYLSAHICDGRPFTLDRTHKHSGFEASEVYTANYNPVSLKETATYLPSKLVPTSGDGLAIVTRVNKQSGREEYLVYDGETAEVYEVRQLAAGRVAEVQARSPKPVARPAPPKRSHKRRASV